MTMFSPFFPIRFRPFLKRQVLRLAVSTAAVATFVLSFAAHAQEAQAQPTGNAERKGWDATIGAGALWVPKFEGANDYEIAPLPYLSIHYGDLFYIEGNEIGVDVVRWQLSDRIKFTLGPVARYLRDRPDDRSKALRGLGNVGTSVEAGAAAKLAIDPAWIRISGGKDVADGHDGTVVQAELGVGFDLAPRLGVSVAARTTWADRTYMNAFFGVTAAQALKSGLPMFRAKDGMKDAGVAASLNYRLSPRWSIAATGGYTRLINDAKDNPLVRLRGSPDQFQAGAFLAFSF
ncbi:outer membrane protein [Sphingomonas sp. UYAg733]